jgi:hypothetical protein
VCPRFLLKTNLLCLSVKVLTLAKYMKDSFIPWLFHHLVQRVGWSPKLVLLELILIILKFSQNTGCLNSYLNEFSINGPFGHNITFFFSFVVWFSSYLCVWMYVLCEQSYDCQLETFMNLIYVKSFFFSPGSCDSHWWIKIFYCHDSMFLLPVI